jgi:hypothetical protein
MLAKCNGPFFARPSRCNQTSPWSIDGHGQGARTSAFGRNPEYDTEGRLLMGVNLGRVPGRIISLTVTQIINNYGTEFH